MTVFAKCDGLVEKLRDRGEHVLLRESVDPDLPSSGHARLADHQAEIERAEGIHIRHPTEAGLREIIERVAMMDDRLGRSLDLHADQSAGRRPAPKIVAGYVGMGDADVLRLEDMSHEKFACAAYGLHRFHAISIT